MRVCYLDNVPVKPYKDSFVYLWKDSIGLKIPFEYDDIKGEFEIIGYEHPDKIYVLYNNKQTMVYGKYIKQGRIEKIFEKEIIWKWNEGDIIQDHVGSHDRHLLIKSRKYIEKNNNPNYRQHKYYQYKCLICGYDCTMDDFWVNEADLKAGKGCGCCAGTKIIVGINDIGTTFPEAVPYIDDINYVHMHTRTSQKITDMTCPYCGYKKRSSVDKLFYQNFGCPKCSDGFSYPEKFFFNILEQCGIDFKYQLNKKDFSWCDKYKYDFYLPQYECIVEVNGRQHYDSVWHHYEQQHQTDIIKRELALSHGIKLYIEIDCSESNKEYIKKSLLNSNLPFNIEEVDYDQADSAAQKNRLRDTCDIYKGNPSIDIKALAKMEQISDTTCVNYLKKGTELGLCNYKSRRKKKVS